MKSKFSFARSLARPSHFVPCLVVVGVAVLPAFLAGGCGSSNSSTNNTDQFTSIPSTTVALDINWPTYASPTPAPSGSPTPTPTPTASPSPTPTPYTEVINTAATGLEAPPNASYARVTLSTADPNTGSVLLLPYIQRVTDGKEFSTQYISQDTAAGAAYSAHYVTYSVKARRGTTNANVRFYDLYGTPLRDYQAIGLKINDDGTGLTEGLTQVTPSPSATPTATASASPSASPSASASP